MKRSKRSAHRAVDDDRPMLGVVLADVVQVEALRRRVIELDRARAARRGRASP